MSFVHRAAAVVVAGAFLVAGCGGDDGKKSNATTVPPSTSETTAASAATAPAASGPVKAVATITGVPPDVPKEFPLPSGATFDRFEDQKEYKLKYLYLAASGSPDPYGTFFRDELKARGWTLSQFSQGESDLGRGYNLHALGFSRDLIVRVSEPKREPGKVFIEAIFETRPDCAGANPPNPC